MFHSAGSRNRLGLKRTTFITRMKSYRPENFILENLIRVASPAYELSELSEVLQSGADVCSPPASTLQPALSRLASLTSQGSLGRWRDDDRGRDLDRGCRRTHASGTGPPVRA